MFKFKYDKAFFETVRTPSDPASEPPLDPFDFDPSADDGLIKRIKGWFKERAARLVLSLVPPLLALLRLVWPNPRIGRLVVVTRAEDVRAVLEDRDSFTVPFGPEMTELAGETNSVLGMDGKAHDVLNDAIKAILPRTDIKDISEWSGAFAAALIKGSRGRIDVMTDLITRAATETCCRYFGFSVRDPQAFAHWTMAVSKLLFADPFGNEETRKLALNGAARIRLVLDDAIARSHKNPNRRNDTLIDRLVGAQDHKTPGHLTDDQIRATLMGLVAGFIPTNTLAAGNMLEELRRRPDILESAKQKARSGDEDGLAAILWEAMRLNPPLFPGQWRYCGDGGFVAQGTWRERRVPENSVVIVSTLSGLRDGRVFPQPGEFDVRRPHWPELMFGSGSHKCLGRYVAMAQITQVFMKLLALPNLRPARGRAGRVRRVGPFPVQLDMVFDAPTSQQTMITITAPVTSGASIESIEKEIGVLGNPAGKAISDALKETGVVHFASLSVIESSKEPGSRPILIFEINADGPRDEALERVADKGLQWFGAIFRHVSPDVVGDREKLAALLRKNALDLKCRPWGATGLNFNGTEEFPIDDILRQERLAKFTRKALDEYWNQYLGRGTRPIEALTRVRRLIKQDPYYALKTTWQALTDEGKEFQYDIVKPCRTRLAIAEWKPVTGWLARIGKVLNSLDVQRLAAIFALGWMAYGISLWNIMNVPARVPDILWAVAASAIASFIVAGLTVSAILAAAAWLYNRNESRCVPDDQPPRLKALEPIVEKEDQPNFEQNHIIAVVQLKPGWFRRLVFAGALWGIKLSLTLWFRPGFVVTMGTIHYAKWFVVPGTGQFIFFGNYDGSWDSYLEDFVTRAHNGQTAAWSNGVGFPRTRWLVLGGAEDGDRFKRWVRRQQRVTRFWYSRYPHLTTRQIRSNAMIEDGLARAANDTEARAWLDHFGSAERQEGELETDEVQSVVFNGFGGLPYATCLMIRFPTTAEHRVKWLKGISGQPIWNRPAYLGDGWSEKWNTADPEESNKKPLARALQVAFGDRPVGDGTAYLAFSARGLKAMELAGAEAPDGLGSFPGVFNLGMARRARILGDSGTTGPQSWGWSDAADTVDPDLRSGADAVLFVYGQCEDPDPKLKSKPKPTLARHRALVALHRQFLEECGGAILHEVPTGPVTSGGSRTLDVEHFGFRDGISQPVIKGTQRAAARPPDRDIVQPGEFLLGYRNNQGFFPPTAFVRAESDHRCTLPVAEAHTPSRFPRFGDQAAERGGRDFGRNGTFVVIRELEQDVERFHEFTRQKADEIAARYPGISTVIGRDVDDIWVAAKMVGRWPDGSPLVGNPFGPACLGKKDRPDNDFAYGTDDPRGLQCPLGAHIRRTNPRDSLEPGNAEEQRITSRHRLLRRGRSFDYGLEPGGRKDKGLLFVCLCADLERQFEFVHHTWMTAPSFHGLTGEPDPMLGGQGRPSNRKGLAAGQPQYGYSIPTAAGTVSVENMASYVTMRGGGYFFLPSRSAILYLADLAGRNAARELAGKAASRREDDPPPDIAAAFAPAK